MLARLRKKSQTPTMYKKHRPICAKLKGLCLLIKSAKYKILRIIYLKKNCKFG